MAAAPYRARWPRIYTEILTKVAMCSGIVLWLVLGILHPSMALASEPLVLSDKRDDYPTSGYLEYLEDKMGTLRLLDVGPMTDAPFTKIEQSANFGFSQSVYWFRLSVTNTHPQQIHWWLEVRNSVLDQIDIYVLRFGTNITHTQMGADVSISDRLIRVRNPVIDLNLAMGEMVQIYLRVKTNGIISVPVFISRPEVFVANESYRQALAGLCYGSILVLLLYNLILFLSTRDINHLLYCLCVASCGMLQLTLDGLAYEYLWPGNNTLNRPITYFLISLCIVTTLLFTRYFLHGAQLFPKLNKLMLIGSIPTLLYGLVWFAVEPKPIATQISFALPFVAMLLVISATVRALRRGIVEAGYLLTAWFCLFLGATVFNLTLYGKLETNFLTCQSIQISIALKAVLLSFALVHRTRALTQENTRFQVEAKTSLKRRVQERTLELNRATQELGKANRLLMEGSLKAVEGDQAQSEFIAAASHDLRQPLQALGFYLRILYEKSPGANEILTKCRWSFTALESLLKSLLDISKLDSNSVQASLHHTELKNIFGRLQKANDYAARLKGLRLVFRGSEHTVFTDPEKLERILSNLIDNAIRYTEQGGILVCGRRREHYLLLQVWDTGPGIPEAEYESVFHEFYRMKELDKDQSSELKLGLGLAIVKRLTILLGIPVSLRSTIGKGVVFSLQVPYGCTTTPAPLADEPIGRHIVALVIDNDAAIRDSMTLLIESWGGAALAVGSSSEAMRAITQEQITPDIIIADYQLDENETGVELVKILYAELQQEIPTVIITGETNSASIDAITKFGKDFIYKPVDPDQLKQIIFNLIKP